MKKSEFIEKIKETADDADIDEIVSANFQLKPSPHADDKVTFTMSELTEYTEKIIKSFKESKPVEEEEENAEIFI